MLCTSTNTGTHSGTNTMANTSTDAGSHTCTYGVANSSTDSETITNDVLASLFLDQPQGDRRKVSRGALGLSWWCAVR